MLSCPATDYSYECSRIGIIEEIVVPEILEKKISKCNFCCSAHMIDSKCVECPVEKYCKRVFCGNCIHMISKNKDIISFLCKTYQHHYYNLQIAYNELKGKDNE